MAHSVAPPQTLLYFLFISDSNVNLKQHLSHKLIREEFTELRDHQRLILLL